MTPVPATPSKPREGGAQGEPILDLVALWRPIRKYWLTMAAIAVLVVVAVGFWTMRQTRIYEAAATVQFDPNPPRPLGGKVESVVELGSGAVWDTREYYETQYQIIQSRRVALDVVTELGLHRDHGFLRNLPPGVTPPDAAAVSEEDAAEILRSRIRVEPMKQSRIATVRLQDADPERAARLLKRIVERYREQNVESVIESTDEASEWLRGEHDQLKSELETNEIALHDYKSQNNMLSVQFDDKSNLLREQIAQLNQTLTSLGTKRDEVASRHAQLAKVKTDDPAVLPATELLQSALLQTLRGQYVMAARERDGLLKSGLGKNNPEVLAAEAQVETSRAALLNEVRNIKGALSADLAALNAQEGSASARFEAAKKDALALNLLEIDYNRLRRSKDNTEKLYSLLLERSKESDLTRRLRVNNVSIIDAPVVPRSPIKPNVPLNLAGGVLVGLLLGAGAALGRNLLDRTMRTPDDVETVLGTTFLGLVPEIAGDAAAPGRRRRRGAAVTQQPELIVHHTPMSGIAEASRAIRTNLLFMAPDKPYRALLVTSAGPSEGKTTLACCVAIAMAQAGKRVLLVDCDLRRPRVHRIFRNTMTSGLSTALVEEDAADCAVETEVPNLYAIAAGPTPPNPSELLQSESFKRFLAKQRERYDHVILDSPPLVAVTDATILSTLVDGTLIVVRAFKTSKELARHAHRLLKDVGAPVAGVVLNAVNLSRDEYKYSYYYYRRDEYYAQPSAPSSSDEGEPPRAPGPHA